MKHSPAALFLATAFLAAASTGTAQQPSCAPSGGLSFICGVQVIIKTTTDRLAALETRLRELQPYELPEFLVVAAAGGSEAYLAWVRESVGSG